MIFNLINVMIESAKLTTNIYQSLKIFKIDFHYSKPFYRPY